MHFQEVRKVLNIMWKLFFPCCNAMPVWTQHQFKDSCLHSVMSLKYRQNTQTTQDSCLIVKHGLPCINMLGPNRLTGHVSFLLISRISTDQMWLLKNTVLQYITHTPSPIYIALHHPVVSVLMCGNHIFSISFPTDVIRGWKATKVNFSSWYPFIILSSPSLLSPSSFSSESYFSGGDRRYIYIFI